MSRKAGGLFQSVRRLAQSVQSTGGRVSVLGVDDEHTVRDIRDWHPLPIQTYPVIGPDRFHFAPKLIGALAENAPDVLSSHGLWNYTSVATLRWHRRTGKPYIVHPHGMLDSWAVRHAQWKKLLPELLYEKRNLRQAACIRALCESEAQAIRAYGLKNPICVIPNGIDPPGRERVLTRAHPLAAAKREGKKVLLYLGRIHPKKGLPNLLRAWKSVATKDWVLAIAGWEEGGHEADLKHLVKELEISAVSFIGPQFGEAKAASYVHSDAFILPSFSEGLPMAVLEAWSYARPALITPGCNLPEGIAAGAGLGIEPDAGSIRVGIEQLFAMSEIERQAMGERGRALVTERFAWPGIARQLQAVAQWLLGGGTAPDCVRLNSSGS